MKLAEKDKAFAVICFAPEKAKEIEPVARELARCLNEATGAQFNTSKAVSPEDSGFS